MRRLAEGVRSRAAQPKMAAAQALSVGSGCSAPHDGYTRPRTPPALVGRFRRRLGLAVLPGCGTDDAQPKAACSAASKQPRPSRRRFDISVQRESASDLGGRCRIRTCVGVSRRIYSPLPLAARATCHCATSRVQRGRALHENGRVDPAPRSTFCRDPLALSLQNVGFGVVG